MRYLATLFFILTLGVGSLFAQSKKSEKQKQDSVTSIVTVKAPNPQLIRQNKKNNKNLVEADQLRNVAGNGTGSDFVLTPKRSEMLGYSNIYQYLQGRVPGLSVGGTTTMGGIYQEDGSSVSGGNTMRIRGASSFLGHTEPLIILDGVQLSSPTALMSLNPENVRSVKVLEGPDAAVYGVQGSNGVIIITTRH